MSKLATFKFCIFLCLFILRVESKTVLNDAAVVSSDLVQDLFFDEIRYNSHLFDILGENITSAQKCINHLLIIINEFPSLKVARFLDSWGKLPSGLLYGHLTDLGNYDECIATSVHLDESMEITKGQYCFASFPITFNEIEKNIRQSPIQDSRLDLSSLLKIKLGVCIPDTCDSKLITIILKKAMANVLNGSLTGVTLSNCSTEKKLQYEALDIFAIVFFSFIGVLLILSTCYDCFTKHFEKKPTQLLLAFSVISNGRKLFMINAEKPTGSINCLTGIRVLSMIWVLYVHSYLYYIIMNVVNIVDAISWYKRAWSMTVLMGSVSVDSFFLLSGLLVAWIGLRELDKTKGKINLVLMWVHRYIRLTPALAALVLFYLTLNKFIGNGPFRESSIEMHNACEEKWWSTLLYIQNYVNPANISWYLAVDTQLYILSPLILIPLWKWGRRAVSVIIIMSLLSTGFVFTIFMLKGYTSLLGFDGKEMTYLPTHARLSAWLVGIGLGYYMHVNRRNTICPPNILQIIGWMISLGTMLSIIFAPYFTISSSHSATVFEAAAYESLKRVSWSIALACIVFACHFGFGGLVNNFLSHPIWQPLGRLNYCIYLVHMAVQTIIYGTSRTDVYFSDYTLILVFWSHFGVSILVSIVLSLAFEAPVMMIEKVVFGSGERKIQ